MKDLKIETEIAKNLAKYWFEKAFNKSIHRKHYGSDEQVPCVVLSDLASILQQLPEPIIEEIEIGINENGKVFEVEPEKQPDITAAELVKKLKAAFSTRINPQPHDPVGLQACFETFNRAVNVVLNHADELLQKRKV